jgi:ribonuclease-3
MPKETSPQASPQSAPKASLPDEQPSEHLGRIPDDQPAGQLAARKEAAARPLHPVESLLEIEFQNPSLLDRAFIHRSYLNELLDDNAELVDNERLEFLGDTVLGYLVSERLYHLFPEQQEGGLTNLRSALVRRETLARMAQDLELGSHLKLGHGEEESGGRTRPATLCAVFEALIGAIYLDQGAETTKDVIFRLLGPDITRLQATTHTKDAKSRLQEQVQANEGLTPRYRVAEAIGPDHAKHFIMLVQVNGRPRGVGEGRSKQEAAQQAAAMALQRMGLPAPEYIPNPELEAQYGLPPEPENLAPTDSHDPDSQNSGPHAT